MTHDKKRFSQLPARSRAVIIFGAVLQFGLQALALRDLKRRPAGQVRGPKKAWVAASFVNFIGPIAYLALGRRQ
ncbi:MULTISPECIES: PLDc N-terminal domain-containing protein [unclassified Gordonia (in: high G+C Gram-positive bacteria)]